MTIGTSESQVNGSRFVVSSIGGRMVKRERCITSRIPHVFDEGLRSANTNANAYFRHAEVRR